jgi:hypothetical protein
MEVIMLNENEMYLKRQIELGNVFLLNAFTYKNKHYCKLIIKLDNGRTLSVSSSVLNVSIPKEIKKIYKRKKFGTEWLAVESVSEFLTEIYTYFQIESDCRIDYVLRA